MATPFPFPVTARKLAPAPGIRNPALYANVAAAGPQLVPDVPAKGAAAHKRAAVSEHAAEALLKRKVQTANDALNYIEAQTDNLDAEIAVIMARKKALTKRFARVEDAAIKFMETNGLAMIEGYRCTWSTAQTPEALDVFDETKVPKTYMKAGRTPPPAPDKNAIKKALNGDAELVPSDWGCKLTSRTKLNRK
jgi:hypothetical protein